MGSTRFFLADLPSRTTEQDLRSLFQDYGHVERIELKTKEQIIDAGETVTKVIAFVTVQTDDAHYCLNELNWQKLHGYKLKVSLAKESFLDRLKRERDEGQQDGQQQTDAHNDYQSSSRLLAQNTQNKRRVFGEHEEINDDEVPIELLITKKRAANSMHNGKIVIQQEQDVKPLHIIEQHKKPAKQKKANLDAKATIADQKRKESLNKMQQQHQQKKSAIQIALSSEAGQAKRIKFSDAEEDDDEEEQQKQKKQTKMDLFDDDDDEEDAEGFQLPQHSGKKGERLVEMQSKQSLDPRFRITSNFVADDENDEDENEQEDEEHHEPQSGQEVSERNWQMGILEQVIGRKIDTAKSDPSKASKNKKMLRFDPAKEEHQKLLRTKAKKPDVVRQQSTDEAVEESATSGTAPVSQSAFYVVTDTLKESLKMRGEGFSLLDMFGSSHEEAAAERQDQLEKLGHEKILVNSKANSSKLGLQSANPFSYDSSDSDEEDEVTEEPATASKENEAPVVKQKQKKQQIQLESFFIPKNDVRLKEGAKFFKSSKPELENENYDEVKKRLKLLITKKIAKTQKAMPGSKTAKKSKSKK